MYWKCTCKMLASILVTNDGIPKSVDKCRGMGKNGPEKKGNEGTGRRGKGCHALRSPASRSSIASSTSSSSPTCSLDGFDVAAVGIEPS